MKKIIIAFCVMLLPVFGFGQDLTGVINDGETGKGLPGANVIEKGTSNGTISDVNGSFTLTTTSKSGEVVISFLGYKTVTMPYNLNSSTDLGIIDLQLDALSMEGVVIVGVGVIDVAKDRETPVAVSTIKRDEILTKSGNQEFPEILKNTPSVYVASQAGGYGDSRISIRGFEQENLALLFNGQPVNGMEDGKVYWSNWQGLSDIASAVQIQRGLGSSKLAISSVGATINVITKATDMKQGGRVAALYGNDNYMKYTAAYSTGLNNKGWGASILLSHWQGDGYNDGTQGLGQTYFVSVGYKPNDTHSFNFSLTGAPQWHNQNYTKKLSAYDRDGDGSITNEEQRFNDNWGYKNGSVYTWRRNFYHKPVANLNWDWKINSKSSLSTVLYASVGQGGGTGPYGNYGLYNFTRDANGQVDFDAITAVNRGLAPTNGLVLGQNIDDGSKYGSADFAARRGSMNMHRWFGSVINYNRVINDNLSFNLGADFRTYYGEHFRLVEDLLGLDGIRDENIGATGFQTLYPGGQVYTQEHSATPYIFWTARNDMNDDKLDYYNTERISYEGVFGQLEYKTDKLSSYVQVAVSNQGYQRFDYQTYALPADQISKKLNNIGYNLKAGANFNLNENHNIFANAGYYSRQPFFDDLFLNHRNDVNGNVGNEGVLGLELGYGYRSEMIDVDINLYNTAWTNRQLRNSVEFTVISGTDTTDVRGTAYYENVQQLHNGIELDFLARPISKLEIGGFASIGNWQYGGNVTSRVYDESQNLIGESTLFLDGVKVGNSAQTSFGLTSKYKLAKGLKIDADWRYYNKLYAAIDPVAFSSEVNDGSLELPSFNLLDAGVSYRLLFSNYNSLLLRVNVNNVLGTQYMSQSDTNIHAKSGDDTIMGVNTSNRVYFGNGRTWNISVSYKF